MEKTIFVLMLGTEKVTSLKFASSIKLTCLQALQADRKLTYLQLAVLHQHDSIGHFWRRLANP